MCVKNVFCINEFTFRVAIHVVVIIFVVVVFVDLSVIRWFFFLRIYLDYHAFGVFLLLIFFFLLQFCVICKVQFILLRVNNENVWFIILFKCFVTILFFVLKLIVSAGWWWFCFEKRVIFCLLEFNLKSKTIKIYIWIR